MGLLDDLGLTPLIKEAQQIKEEFSTIKGQVVDTVADQSKLIGEIKGSATDIKDSIVSQVSGVVSDVKETVQPPKE